MVVENHSHSADSTGSFGMVMGILLLVIFLWAFFVYGLPYMRRGTGSPQISVPEQVDVNVNQGGQQ